MKRVLAFLIIITICVLSLSACSTDFSDTVEGKMDELYEKVRDVAEPYLKQDEKYNTSTSSDTESTESSTEVTE